MVNSRLVRTEDEMRELHHFLLMRAREEEAKGSTHTGRVYREYALTVSQQLDRGRGSRRLNSPPGTGSLDVILKQDSGSS